MPNVVEIRVCRECNAEFPFTQRDLDFYTKQGWTTRPNRCKPCRMKRKERNEDDIVSQKRY